MKRWKVKDLTLPTGFQGFQPKGVATLSDRNSLKEVPPKINQSCFVSKISFSGLKDYWTLLSEKRDAVVEVPLARKEPQDV